MRPTLAKIYLNNLIFNYLNLRKKARGAKVMPVIKADAYGHGSIECSKALEKLSNKAPEYFGVALYEEAIELRQAGIKTPILCFAPFGEKEAKQMLDYDIEGCLCDACQFNILKKFHNKLKIHLKIDTGMGRLGFRYDEAKDFILRILKFKPAIKGIFTHFATSDERNKNYAYLQLKRFKEILSWLKDNSIDYGLAHCANSGAILDMPESYIDMVRPGISLYGYYPSLETTESVKLKLVMELVSKIESIKKINKGESVSYGRKFIAKKDTIIATVPIGYADGYNRNLTNRSIAYCKKNILSQAGRVCMDRIMFEIDDKNIKAGDEIILLGRNNFFNFDAWEWSKILNTIPYEILCCIGKRVRREYL